MSEKQVEIKLVESEAKLLKKFLGFAETELIEKICKEYGMTEEGYKVDDVLYKIYQQLDCKLETKESTVSKLIAEIERLATLINIKREHTVFIYNHGHCGELEVQVYLGGWTNLKDKSLSNHIDYDFNYKFFKYEKCISELEETIEKLNKLYKGEI